MRFNAEPRDTDELQSALMDAPNLDAFLKENEGCFIRQSVQEILNQLFLKTQLSKAELARRSGISAVYLHQVFSGRRTPSRDRLICLAIGLSATLDELQAMLRRAGLAELYPKNRRDAIILYGISQQDTLHQINEQLFEMGEGTLV